LTLVIISSEIQEECESVNWTKLMQILKVTGTDQHERRVISKLYVDQSVKLKLDRGRRESEDWKRS